MLHSKTFVSGIACAVAMLTGSQAAFAQSAAPVSSDGTDTSASEIVVTAERRSEKLNQVPTAISVLSGDELQRRGVLNLDELKSQVPSLSVQDQGFLSYVNIRGIGLSVVNPTTSSGVANYTDGFYIPHETAIGNAYYDLQQIEVLRGPQGTINGANATGGAIFLVSNKPDFSGTSARAEIALGNYNNREGQLVVNAPISDTLAIRIAGQITSRDSYSTNIVAGVANPTVRPPMQPGNLSANGMRVSLRWKPSGSVENNLKFEYESRRTDGIASKPLIEVYPTLFGTTLADPRLANPFVIDNNDPTKNDSSFYRVVNELKVNLSDNILLRSLTGYQHQESSLLYDMDGTSAVSVVGQHRFYEETFQQELNLISQNDGPFNWVVGGFFLRDKLPVDLSFFNGGFTLNNAPVAKSYAGFAEVKITPSPKWQILVGGRVSHDYKIEPGTVFGVFNYVSKTSSTKPTGRVAISYFPSENSSIYASVSRGYKAGGINDNDIGSAPTFNPELITAYEAGFKAPLMGRMLNAQGAVFYYDYSNFQQSIFNPASGQAPVRNAEGATLYGFEAQLNGRFGSGGFDFSAAYTHSKLGNLITRDGRGLLGGTSPTLDINVGGRSIPYAPEWTLSASAYYDFALNGGKLTPRVQFSYVSEQFASIFQVRPYDAIPAYSLLNASLRYTSSNNFFVELYGKNITDKLYVVGQNGLPSGYMYGAPRQYGVRIGASF